MSDTNTTIATLENLGSQIVPVIVEALLNKLDPTCDVAGAKSAVTDLISAGIALEKALTTKTETATNA
ncbi:hypothetical protein J2D73_12520 [Acetobacter sacchari]|uniref:Uncharacterized protein n=1 Tax=Acetobacter sacchari TaxID=2661687 RepID=A0ABS3LXI4_9PROT|nr:hypothetical protein [Acetobacter sacchari]MBO1360612.1 hypothetical protein [Acetobacter sacchari]